MVYVPLLKIDLPEPRLQELIPGLVTAVLGACTLAFDAVYDLLHPLPPEGQLALYEGVLTHLPREFRKARKRIVALDIKDDDKVSEELETASYNYYRRRMREEAVGYSDEETEDVTFRRLMSPASASRQLLGPTPLDTALEAQDWQEVQQLLAATQPHQAAAVAALPSRGRRLTVTTAVGGVGLALGVGVVKLVSFVGRRLQKQRRKARRRSTAAAGQQPGSRRQSEQGGSGRRSSTGGRVTPRQR